MVELTEIKKQTTGRRVGIQSPPKILTSYLATTWPNFCTPNYQQMILSHVKVWKNLILWFRRYICNIMQQHKVTHFYAFVVEGLSVDVLSPL